MHANKLISIDLGLLASVHGGQAAQSGPQQRTPTFYDKKYSKVLYDALPPTAGEFGQRSMVIGNGNLLACSKIVDPQCASIPPIAMEK